MEPWNGLSVRRQRKFTSDLAARFRATLAVQMQSLAVGWTVFVTLMLFGAARACMMPAIRAVLVNLVPSARFGKAEVLSSSGFQVGVILKPALSGVPYLAGPSRPGPGAVYLCAPGLLVLSVLLMSRTRAKKEQTAGDRSARAGPIAQ